MDTAVDYDFGELGRGISEVNLVHEVFGGLHISSSCVIGVPTITGILALNKAKLVPANQAKALASRQVLEGSITKK